MPEDTDQTTFDNELRGVLFRNDKGDNPKRPDFRGNCTIGGKGYKISGWTRKAKQSGQSFLSLSYTRDEALDPKSAIGPDVPIQDPTDDLPF